MMMVSVTDEGGTGKMGSVDQDCHKQWKLGKKNGSNLIVSRISREMLSTPTFWLDSRGFRARGAVLNAFAKKPALPF